MEIFIPDSIQKHEPHIRFFVDLMVAKLEVNRHKGWVDDKTYDHLRSSLTRETEELDKAFRQQSQFDAILEAVDVANQSLLLAMYARGLSKDQYEVARKTQASPRPETSNGPSKTSRGGTASRTRRS